MLAEPGRERRVERIEVLAPGAEHRAEREVGVGARGRVDRGERPVGRQQLADTRPHTAGAERGDEPGEPRRYPQAAIRQRKRTIGHSDYTPSKTRCSDNPLDVLTHLERHAEGLLEVGVVQGQQRPCPVDRLPHARQLVELLAAQPSHGRADSAGDLVRHTGHPRSNDLGLAPAVRVLDPVIEAAALERVVELARAVGGDHHQRPAASGNGAELRDRHLEVGQELEQEGLELVVGAVHLVDQQHHRALVLERLEQRSPQQVLAREQLPGAFAPAFGGADRQQLPRVVPVVERVVEVDALVALEADQPRPLGLSKRLPDLGLPDAGLALEQERLLQGLREEDRRCEATIGQVTLGGERLQNFVDGSG